MIIVDNISKKFLLPMADRRTVRESMFGLFRPGGVEEFSALADVSFEVQNGEFFGIVGANGSGKSTLLKILARVYKADSGRVTVSGKVAPFLELGIGFHPELTARENVLLSGLLLGLRRREIERKFDEVIAFAGLERFTDTEPKHYSSGMQARLAFSVAIQVDADVYLLDEVFAVGDQAFQEQCLSVFERWKKERKTVVLVTHGLDAVERYCDRAIWLDKGSVVVEDSAPLVVARYREKAKG